MEAVMGKDSRSSEFSENPRRKQIRPGERHPLFGALKGLVHVPSGVDLTEPADPNWGNDPLAK
jgi:hypothetical protein